MRRTTKIPRSPCPECGSKLDRATRLLSDATPSPGDCSICALCCHLGVYGPDLRIREPSPAERFRLLCDFEVQATIRAVQAARRSWRR